MVCDRRYNYRREGERVNQESPFKPQEGPPFGQGKIEQLSGANYAGPQGGIQILCAVAIFV